LISSNRMTIKFDTRLGTTAQRTSRQRRMWLHSSIFHHCSIITKCICWIKSAWFDQSRCRSSKGLSVCRNPRANYHRISILNEMKFWILYVNRNRACGRLEIRWARLGWFRLTMCRSSPKCLHGSGWFMIDSRMPTIVRRFFLRKANWYGWPPVCRRECVKVKWTGRRAFFLSLTWNG